MPRSGPPFRYRVLADALARQVEAGVLRPGEPVPSLRKISRQEGLSLVTALQAYRFLEARGYLEARPQSGYYVRDRRAALPPEPGTSAPADQATPVAVRDLVAAVLRQSQDPALVPLGAATVASPWLPLARLNRILGAQLRARGPELQALSYPPGELELRRQIARRSLDWGGQLRPEDVVITCGATQALDLCVRATARPGDLVAVESPCYFGTLALLEALGHPVVEIPSDPRGGIRLDALERILASQPVRLCILSPTVSNPLGASMGEDAKQTLLGMLAVRSVPLIEDDPHGDLAWTDPRPRPVKALDWNGSVLYCSSFSKVLAPGFRIGWTAPGRWRDPVAHLQTAATLAVPRMLQTAIAEFLESGGFDRHLRTLRAACAAQAERVAAAIGAAFPEGTRVTRPTGGCLLWLELPPAVDALRLAREALAHGISVCPGPIFSARGDYRNHLRLSCGQPWSDRMAQAVATLGRLARAQVAGGEAAAGRQGPG